MDYRIEIMPVAELLAKADPRNAMLHDEDEIRRLTEVMHEHGVLASVCLNTRTDHLVGGHARVIAAHRNQIETLPVIVVDFDELRERAANTALNASYGHWNEDQLRQTLRAIEEADYSLDFTGLEEWKIKDIFAAEQEDTKPAKGFGTPNITYVVIFDSAEQRSAWKKFANWVQSTYEDAETLGQALDAHFAEVLA